MCIHIIVAKFLNGKSLNYQKNNTCVNKCYFEFFLDIDNKEAKAIDPIVLPSNVIHKNNIESKLIVLEATK